MAPQERRFFVNGIHLAAQEWGRDGQLPVIALHGWLDNSATFDKLLPLLPDIHVIALDMAGHGQSEHRPGLSAYNAWDDIRDIFAVADELGWEKFVLLGHSRGAIISTLAAGTFPERIHALALIEGFIPDATSAEQAPQQLARAIKEFPDILNKQRTLYKDIELAIRAREKGMFPLGYSAASSLTRRGIKAVDGGFVWTYDPKLYAPSMVKFDGNYIKAFVDAITAPICLLLAADGLPKFYANYLQLMEKYPAVTYQLLEGGHHLHIEDQAPDVAARFQVFFNQLPVMC